MVKIIALDNGKRLADETKTPLDFKMIGVNIEKRKDYFETIKEMYLQLCDMLEKTKKSHNQKLRDNVLDYIDKHYRQTDMGVSMMATSFNLAENYFSQFFSEQVGETFSHYLEKKRISHACELLTDGKMTIDKVSKDSGYNNTNTFRRAFKRVTGTTPSNFAQSKIHADS